MTTNLTKQFFDTFGIKTKYIYHIKDTSTKLCYFSATKKDILDYFTNKNHRKYKVFNVKIEHPQITDHILLELICILNENTTLDETYYQGASTVKELKKLVLKDLIKTKDNFDTIQQVQKLFKEG